MGERQQAGKPSRYVTSHPDQLSLAIPSRVDAVSTSKAGEEINVFLVFSHCSCYVIAKHDLLD